MADVDIVVDSGDLKAAIDLLNEYGMSFTNMVNKVQTESNKLARASKATANQVEKAWDNAQNAIENKRLEEVTRQEQTLLKRREQNWKQFFNQTFMKNTSASASGAPSSAKDSVLVQMLKDQEKAARETAVATKELARETDVLTSKYNPLLAAQKQYETMQSEINRSLQLTIINDKQHAAALQQLETEYQALNKGVYLAGSRFNQFGEMSGLAGKSANRFGMYAQQAGYQVGDFAVQLQSGTNAGVAFSQQAAQLAGLIPGLAGALTTFAAIGIGLVIQQWIIHNKEVRDTKKIYEDLGSTLDKIEAVRFENISSGLSEAAISARREFQALFDLIEKQELKNLSDNLMQPLKQFAKELEGFQSRNSLSNQIGNGDASFNYLGFEDVNKAARAFEWLAQIQGESKEELSESLELVTNILNNTGLMTDELGSQLAVMANELGIVESVNKELEHKQTISENIKNSYQEATKSIAEQLRTQRQNIELSSLASEHGKTSLNYLNTEKEIRLQNYRIELESMGLEESMVQQRLRSMEILEDMRISQEASLTSTTDIFNVLQSIAGVDISGIFTRAQAAAVGLLSTVNAVGRGLAQLGKLQQESQALKAQRDALANGSTPGEARVAGDVVRYGNSLEGVPNWARGLMQNVYRDQQLENLSYNEEITADTKSAKGGGKSKKSKKSDAEKDLEKAKEKLSDFIEEFDLNIKQQERLSGVFGEQRDKLEKVIEIENRLGDARSLVSEKQIQAWAQQELALEERLEREQQLHDTVSQNFENFLMTVVKGTGSIEDAFKAMISSIITDLYQQFVAKQAASAVGSWFSGLFAANGHAFNSNGQVQYFAKGGVVDSPTAFRHSGGLGVMGEAGPEAIMPLKRNAQGKLGVAMQGGGSGDVNITQVFNMSANGDKAVKDIIQAQMPQIREASVRAVIDAKRRNVRGIN